METTEEENINNALAKQMLGFEQQNKIKLIKNSRGYGWELSLLSLDIDELERINNKMIEKFGSLA